MFSTLHLADVWEVSASLENGWAGVNSPYPGKQVQCHRCCRACTCWGEKKRLHAFWEIKLRLCWNVQAVHWNSLIWGAGRRDCGRDGGQEQTRIKKWHVRKAISVKPQNSFARMKKYETWPCSALVNLWLWRPWWRMKCFVVPAQSWINFSMWTFMSRCVKLKDYFFQISVFRPLLLELFTKPQHCPYLP